MSRSIFSVDGSLRGPSPRTVDGVRVDLEAADGQGLCQRNPVDILKQKLSEKKQLNENNPLKISERIKFKSIFGDCTLERKGPSPVSVAESLSGSPGELEASLEEPRYLLHNKIIKRIDEKVKNKGRISLYKIIAKNLADIGSIEKSIKLSLLHRFENNCTKDNFCRDYGVEISDKVSISDKGSNRLIKKLKSLGFLPPRRMPRESHLNSGNCNKCV